MIPHNKIKTEYLKKTTLKSTVNKQKVLIRAKHERKAHNGHEKNVLRTPTKKCLAFVIPA